MRTLRSKLNQLGDGILCPMALIFKNNQLLIGLRNYTPDKWKVVSVWTTPGGRSEKGETIESTLRREVEEEVGIIDLKINEFLGEFPGAKEGDLVYVFKCSTSKEPKLLEPEKFSEWRWSDVKDIPENFINSSLLNFIKSKF